MTVAHWSEPQCWGRQAGAGREVRNQEEAGERLAGVHWARKHIEHTLLFVKEGESLWALLEEKLTPTTRESMSVS